MEERFECETQEEANSLCLTQALTVPVAILLSRFRNKREVELVMEASNFAVIFDAVLEKYEMVSVRAQALQEAWDNLWISQEPLLVPAIPLIGEKMSGINRMRAHLLKKMDTIIENLQVVAKGLLQYAEINLSVGQELRLERIDWLATDKIFLSELEQELSKRINIVCTKGSIHKLSGKMSDFIESLKTRLECRERPMCDEAIQNQWNSMNKEAEPDQDTDPIIYSSIKCQEQIMQKDYVSTYDSRALHSQQNNSGQTDSALACGVAFTTSAMGTCFASEGLAHNNMDIKFQNPSSLASKEQLPDLGSNIGLIGLLQKWPTNKDNQVGIGDKHMHVVNQDDMDVDYGSDGANSVLEASKTA